MIAWGEFLLAGRFQNRRNTGYRSEFHGFKAALILYIGKALVSNWGNVFSFREPKKSRHLGSWCGTDVHTQYNGKTSTLERGLRGVFRPHVWLLSLQVCMERREQYLQTDNAHIVSRPARDSVRVAASITRTEAWACKEWRPAGRDDTQAEAAKGVGTDISAGGMFWALDKKPAPDLHDPRQNQPTPMINCSLTHCSAPHPE